MKRPEVILPDFKVMFCAHCLEPLRITWPAGAGLAALGLLNAVLEDDRAVVATGGDVANIPPFMESVRPVCEWVGRKKASEVIQAALDGKCYGHKGNPHTPDAATPHP